MALSVYYRPWSKPVFCEWPLCYAFELLRIWRFSYNSIFQRLMASFCWVKLEFRSQYFFVFAIIKLLTNSKVSADCAEDWSKLLIVRFYDRTHELQQKCDSKCMQWLRCCDGWSWQIFSKWHTIAATVLNQAKTNLYLEPCLLFIFIRIVDCVTVVATEALYTCDRILSDSSLIGNGSIYKLCGLHNLGGCGIGLLSSARECLIFKIIAWLPLIE